MQKKIMVITSILTLVFFNYTIYQKELIKKNGKIILLELSPYDPRSFYILKTSLLQGNYMRLGYKIEDIIRKKKII